MSSSYKKMTLINQKQEQMTLLRKKEINIAHWKKYGQGEKTKWKCKISVSGKILSEDKKSSVLSINTENMATVQKIRHCHMLFKI